jgi:hypothetical protein
LQKREASSQDVSPLPEFLSAIAQQISAAQLIPPSNSQPLNQCTVNEYLGTFRSLDFVGFR